MAGGSDDKVIPPSAPSDWPASFSAAGLAPAFLDALVADFARHGAEAIQRCREDSPATYVRICAGLIPKQLKIDSANDLDDSELDRRIQQLAKRLALEIGTGGPVDGEREAAEPQSPPGLPALR